VEVLRMKLFAFLVTTADGYYEGPNQEFDWPVVDDEFNQFAIEQLEEIDTLVFGRNTYEAMASYWPTPLAQQNDPVVAGKMNGLPKIVVSTTLGEPTWQNTRLIGQNVAEEIAKLKQQPGKALAIFGSSDLTVRLMKLGLVDELRIMVHPVILGAGNSVFRTSGQRFRLKLLNVRQFDSGNVMLYYQPVSA
jgi:dihydrofolate reductase